MMDYLRKLSGLISGNTLVEYYSEPINGTVVVREDEFLDNYWFTKAYIVFPLIALYLTIALRGPKWMENRPPYDLRKYLIYYNAAQVFLCSLYLYMVFFAYVSPFEVIHFVYSNICRPVDKPYESNKRLYALHGAAFYLLMKLGDLPDTLFMVARKQFSHITFLHLFHHTTMVLSMWYHVAYVRGELGAVFGLINVFVHIIMYSYYFITALGPTYKKKIGPWKKYVTLIQMGQFGVILALLVGLSWGGCEMPPNMMNMWFFNNILFLVLFMNYYFQTFLLKKKTQ